MVLPRPFLPDSAPANRPRVYPLGINLSATVRGEDSVEEVPSPFPFLPEDWTFASLRIGGELSWSPGIFQLRTRWHWIERAERDGALEGSVSLAARLGSGRVSARVAWRDFPANPDFALAWRWRAVSD